MYRQYILILKINWNASTKLSNQIEKNKKKVDQRSGQNEQTIMSRALCIVDQSLLKYISDDIVQPDYIFCLMIHT